MDDPKYILEIDALLRKIAELERSLSHAEDEQERIQIQRCLKNKEKRLEHLTPFRFRLQLRNLCKKVGVSGSFLDKN